MNNEARDKAVEAEKPKKGEVWFVKMDGASALSTVIVLDVTEKTVLVKDADKKHYEFNLETRYSIADIEFIERRQK